MTSFSTPAAVPARPVVECSFQPTDSSCHHHCPPLAPSSSPSYYTFIAPEARCSHVEHKPTLFCVGTNSPAPPNSPALFSSSLTCTSSLKTSPHRIKRKANQANKVTVVYLVPATAADVTGEREDGGFNRRYNHSMVGSKRVEVARPSSSDYFELRPLQGSFIYVVTTRGGKTKGRAKQHYVHLQAGGMYGLIPSPQMQAGVEVTSLYLYRYDEEQWVSFDVEFTAHHQPLTPLPHDHHARDEDNEEPMIDNKVFLTTHPSAPSVPAPFTGRRHSTPHAYYPSPQALPQVQTQESCPPPFHLYLPTQSTAPWVDTDLAFPDLDLPMDKTIERLPTPTLLDEPMLANSRKRGRDTLFPRSPSKRRQQPQFFHSPLFTPAQQAVFYEKEYSGYLAVPLGEPVVPQRQRSASLPPGSPYLPCSPQLQSSLGLGLGSASRPTSPIMDEIPLFYLPSSCEDIAADMTFSEWDMTEQRFLY